jgi:hypothetical protein
MLLTTSNSASSFIADDASDSDVGISSCGDICLDDGLLLLSLLFVLFVLVVDCGAGTVIAMVDNSLRDVQWTPRQ